MHDDCNRRIAELEREIADLRTVIKAVLAQNEELRAENLQLKAENTELRARLGQNPRIRTNRHQPAWVATIAVQSLAECCPLGCHVACGSLG